MMLHTLNLEDWTKVLLKGSIKTYNLTFYKLRFEMFKLQMKCSLTHIKIRSKIRT